VETAELTAILQEVRDRVRARHPDGAATATPLPDLQPLLRARDAAEAKVAAIGTVNPRSGGLLNSIVQRIKRLIARALDWHIREQVEFNRNVMACVQTTLEALEEMRHSMAAIHSETRNADAAIDNRLRDLTSELRGEVQQLKDIRKHWAEWRPEWETRLVNNDTRLLHGVAESNAAFQFRTTQMEVGFRDLLKSQIADFHVALDRATLDIQKRLWADLERIQADYERLIHYELRQVRQRAASLAGSFAPAPAVSSASGGAPLAFDYTSFAARFRGTEEYVKQGQQFYLPLFEGRRNVLDIGCGRGEFLELMRDAGVPARGIDLGEESVGLCRAKGLQAEVADLFPYLENLPEESLDGIFSAQVVEHLPPERLPEMIRLAGSRLARGGVLLIETPNPECLAIFASHFYLDPTHYRPVPHALLAFYMEENGIALTPVHRRSPAVESMPSLASLPEDFREAFFGGLDYAIVGHKL
jgi:2-polyprenyl-3-methyl-5-hydroxy-6-metoxy-1,4-benzoquinol methylase